MQFYFILTVRMLVNRCKLIALSKFKRTVKSGIVVQHQQNCHHKRKDDKRRQMTHFGRRERKDGVAQTGNHRGERYVVRNHQYDEPNTGAEQNERRIYGHYATHKRCDALTTAEARENGEALAQHSTEEGCKTQHVEPIFIGSLGEYLVVFDQVDNRDGNEALQKIKCKDRNGGTASQYAQHVGCAGVFRAMFANINAVIAFADPYSARNRAQQIGDYEECRDDVVC